MNQKEIAERLNLSRTTVSRCFTNHPKINPETRARVFELAAQMGYSYSPPRNVTEERPRAANSVAVLVGLTSNAGERVDTAREILAGISERLAAERLTLKVNYVDPSGFDLNPRSRRILPGMNNAEVMGFILMYPFKEYSVGNLITKFPTVSALDDYENLEVDCVDVDQTRGISSLMSHLHKLGHQEFGFISWKYTLPTPWVEHRFGVYVENLFRYRLPFRKEHLVNVYRDQQVDPDAVVEAALKMIDNGVTALVCAADHQAYHLVRELRKRGLRIPRDVSVTGFDGETPPRGLPQLTTIRTPFRDIGVSSVVSLLRRVSHPSAARRHILVSGRTIVGSTTGRPREK